MSLRSRVKSAEKWYREAMNRYFGARKNLRIVRDEIEQINKRLPDAQGGVKEKLEQKKKELVRRQQKLAYQVKHRKKIADHLKKKWKVLEEKQKDHKPPSSGPGWTVVDRPWNPNRCAIPNWMIPWLDKSWNAGWRGQVNSGVRTPEHSVEICYGMCGQSSCPGTCAGVNSNHNMTAGQGYPYGAIDVSDYYTFERIQWQIGSPLKNDLPSDPVHFSVTGH